MRKKKGEISSTLPILNIGQEEVIVAKQNSIRQAVWRNQKGGKKFSIEILDEKEVVARITRTK